MVFYRSGSNLILVVIVAVLALTAAAGLYLSAGRPEIMPSPGQPQPETRQDPPRQKAALESSIAGLEQLIAKTPDNPEYHAQIADLYFDLGRYNEALTHYQESLKLDPDNPNIATALATCYHYIGMDDEALEILERVIENHPDFSPAKLNKGVVLIYGKNDTERGLSIWEDLLRSDPGFQYRDELEERIQQVRQAGATTG
ncbi:MAG TPA: tetratricopeptide repeat protein [Acidobacteriota bacterium]|nr:tetratricopeptide repeat protein [Acidobacteriota bacterium]